MTLVQTLRRETAADHDRVDARYAGFALTSPQLYTAFLLAHARALPAVEAALAGDTALPTWRERTSLLRADLAEMGAAMPPALPFALQTTAERWGALYVIEGSRLGGMLLARDVPPTLPSRYLAAKHLPGEWRALLAELDRAAIDADAALAGARATFALYLDAATPRSDSGSA